MMIQQIYLHDPWKMLIGCIMLNQTSNQQVRPVIKEFFKRWPSPQSVIDADDEEMKDVIRSLGLYNRRTKSIKNFSRDWVKLPKGTDILSYRGLGQYAKDSYEIFINKNLNVNPTDKVLIRYLKENKMSNNYT